MLERYRAGDYDGRTGNGELTEEYAVESLVFIFENMSDSDKVLL
jgi:hypothetical protein